MPFKPLSNALLSPYKVPFGVYLYNYLITNNLRRLLSNPFFHPSPTFTLHILSIYFDECWMLGAGCWVVDVEWWVLMVSIKFIVNPHIIITQHSIPHIINTQHPSPIPQHSTPHIINTQHPTPITQHSSPNIQPHTSSTPITQHPTPNTHHFPPH